MIQVIQHPSPNFEARHGLPEPHRGPSMIVLHATQTPTAAQALHLLCDAAALNRVSAHFLIDYDGTTYNLVDPLDRAWHAGESSWKGITDVNSLSIGIELQNNFEPYPEAQFQALVGLLGGVCQQYDIDPSAVWGHADIAPHRKVDPAGFPWRRLLDAGFGTQVQNAADLAALARLGYNVLAEGAYPTEAVLRAARDHA